MIEKFIGLWTRTVVEKSDQWTYTQKDTVVISVSPTESVSYLKSVIGAGKKTLGALEYHEEQIGDLKFDSDGLSFSVNSADTLIISFKAGSGTTIRKVDGRVVETIVLSPSARTINATISGQGLLFGGQLLSKVIS